MPFMNATTEIDKAGRLVVPKKMRDALHLVPGTRVTFHQDGETIVLRPEHQGGGLVEEDGLLVWTSDVPVTFDILEEIERGRTERMQDIVGDWIKL
jgi:AbrB family looped-hinge helix DNA binding protein